MPFEASVAEVTNMGEIRILFSRPILVFNNMPEISEEHLKMEIISDNIDYKKEITIERKLKQMYSTANLY